MQNQNCNMEQLVDIKTSSSKNLDQKFPNFLSSDSNESFQSSYCEWNRKVDLSPSEFVKEISNNDKLIIDYYDALQYILYQTNYPETEDRTAVPRTSLPESGISIVVLASPVECMAILLEGGRKCPGDMLLVLSKSWITLSPSDLDPSMNSLSVHKAISFDKGGRSFIDVFDPPRRVTYFVNFFTNAITGGQNAEGKDLEVNLECPMSSSMKLVRRTDDKLWTRIIMAKAGIAYPETLAFGYQIPYKYTVPEDAKIKIVGLSLKEGVDNVIQDEIVSYLNSLSERVTKVVVKPSGIKWNGCKGVSFHDRQEVKSICDAAISLLWYLEPGDGILLEDFCDPSDEDMEMKDYSFRIRANVCRAPGDVPITTTLVCGVGMKDGPVGGCNSNPQSLETTLIQWNLQESTEEIKEMLIQGSERILSGIIDHENALSVFEKGGIGAQTNIIGIDYFLSKRGEKYVPVGIEVNSHDCIRCCQRYEFINPSSAGKSVWPLVETMIERSQAFMLRRKTILVLGLGAICRKLVLEAVIEEKFKIALIDTIEDNSTPCVSKYIQYNFSDHTQDDLHADSIVKIFQKQNIDVNGCCTFLEECTVLAAMINKKLGCLGAGVKGVAMVKKKSEIEQVLSRCVGDISHFPKAYLYVERSAIIDNIASLSSAVAEVGLPCVLKLECGPRTVCMEICQNLAECSQAFNDLQNKMSQCSDSSVVAIRYIKGTVHNVDLVVFRRKLVAAFVVDNGSTRPGSFTETAACMPSCLSSDKVGQLVTAAYQCCMEIGLENGVFNVEMKMTPMGPKLIKINARMGGFYYRHWILKCYGVDMVKYVFMIASGIKPIPPKLNASCHIMGVAFDPSTHADVLDSQKFRNAMEHIKGQNDVILTADKDLRNPSFAVSNANQEEPMCSVAVCTESRVSAKEKLLSLCITLGVGSPEYNVQHLISDFR